MKKCIFSVVNHPVVGDLSPARLKASPAFRRFSVHLQTNTLQSYLTAVFFVA
jgi:hypothetical protein